MKISVPTSWNDKLIEGLNRINSRNDNIAEIYGALPTTPVGSARPSLSLPKVSIEEAKRHIKLAHDSGLSFNYLLNAPCIAGLEYGEYREEIMRYIDTIISELNPDILTITIPFLIEKVKRKYPSIKIKASTEARIDNVYSAKFYEELGVSRICLDSNINRNFAMLREIRNHVNCELEVIVNKSCLLKCPMRIYHGLLMGHFSQSIFERSNSYTFDFPSLKCTLKKLESPEEIIKSPWIRPEDCLTYEEIGISHFKISGRTKPTEWILRCAEAYSNGEYKGNLLDLLDAPGPFKKEGQVYALPFFIRNVDLNGFLDFFRDSKCNGLCNKCNYCKKAAERVIKITSSDELKERQLTIRNLIFQCLKL